MLTHMSVKADQIWQYNISLHLYLYEVVYTKWQISKMGGESKKNQRTMVEPPLAPVKLQSRALPN